MWFLGLGLVGVALKWLELTQVATWPWWVVLAPFGLAVLWWTWADASGFSKRKAMEKEDKRVKARLERQRQAMGLPGKRR